LFAVDRARSQSVEITGVPTPGLAGQITGTVTGFDPATHEVALSLFVDGITWGNKPDPVVGNFGGKVPINPDGTFSGTITSDNLDPYASIYVASVIPLNASFPTLAGGTLDLGPNSLAHDIVQRYGKNLQFAGRDWGIKEAPLPTQPGWGRYSADSNDVWVDPSGNLNLTLKKSGGNWFSTEVVLSESLGYGTYAFQTSSELNLHEVVTFAGFTYDPFGDEFDIPSQPFREIDFEVIGSGPLSAQSVVQPIFDEGSIQRFTLPDLSIDPSLTWIIEWSPGQIDFTVVKGLHTPDSFTAADIVEQYSHVEGGGNIVPSPGRENFRFSLWANNHPAIDPLEDLTANVVINDFLFIPQLTGDYDNSGAVGSGDLGVWEDTFGQQVSALYSGADGNGNGQIDGSDFLLWQRNFVSGTPLAGAAAVPEPNSLLLLLGGIVYAYFRRGTFIPAIGNSHQSFGRS